MADILDDKMIDELVARGQLDPATAAMAKNGRNVNPYVTETSPRVNAGYAVPAPTMTPVAGPAGPPVSPYVQTPVLNAEMPVVNSNTGFNSGIPENKISITGHDTEQDKARIAKAKELTDQARQGKFGTKETELDKPSQFFDELSKVKKTEGGLNTDSKSTNSSATGGTGVNPLSDLLTANKNYYDTVKSLIDSSTNIQEKQSLQQALQARVVSDQNEENNKLLQAKEDELLLHKKQRLEAAKIALLDLNARADDLANYKEDPERLWNSKSTLGKASVILGAIFGGMGGGMTHSNTNAGMDQYNRMVDQDIAAQRAGYNAQSNSYKAKDSAYGRMMDLYKDQDSADAASRVLLIDQGERKLKQLMLSSASQQVQAQGQQALNQLALQRAQAEREFAFSQYKLAHPGTGSAAGEKGVHQFTEDQEKAGLLGEEANLNLLKDLLGKIGPNGEIPTLETRNVGSRAIRGFLDWFGGAGTGTNLLDTPQEREYVATLSRIKNDYLHALSGAAISPSEMERLREGLALVNNAQGMSSWIADRDRVLSTHKAALAAGSKPEAVATQQNRQKAYTPPPTPQKPSTPAVAKR